MKNVLTCSTLGSVAEIQTGPFGSQLHAADYVSVGIPSIMPNSIGSRLEVLEEKTEKITAADAQRLKKYLVQSNDIIYSRRGDVEKCAFITPWENGWLCGTGCLRVRFTSERVCPQFCAYYLSTDEIKGWVSGNAVGTTMPNLNTQILQRLPLVLPPLAEQQAIAAVLSSLDDKIDLIHRQNKTLEALAQTLFRQWFVEEADEREKRNIAEFIDFNPKRKLEKGTNAPYIEMSALSSTSFSPSTWYNRDFSSGTKFTNGDTLLARITPCLENGKAAFIQCLQDGETAWGSTEYIVLRPKRLLHPLFAYALVKTADFREYAESCLAGSSGRQRVELRHLMQYSLRMPTPLRIQQFNECMESLLPRLVKNANQIHTLTKLRDTLLPKLMSGEVRVEV